MFVFMRIAIVVTICGFLMILATNLSGFFTKPQDDPAWKDPAAAKPAAAPAANANASADSPGAKVYAARCAMCHQANGAGMPGVYPPLAASEWASGEPSRPIRIVLNGFQGKIMRAGKEVNGVMTPWKDILSDEEIAQALTYVRSSWGNSGAAIDAKTVADVRAKTAAKAGAYSEDELKNPL